VIEVRGFTTTMRMALGLDRPTSGTALVNRRPFGTLAGPGTAGALITAFLLMLVLPLCGYAWMSAIAEALPGSGAVFLLIGEAPGMTTASSVTTLLAWAGGALLLGWLRLVRDDANR